MPALPAAQALEEWGPRGRVLDRATGKPAYWTSITYERRFGVAESPGTWTEFRDPLEKGEEPPADPGRFDLGPMLRPSRQESHVGTHDILAAEFRVVVLATGYRKAATDWTRLSEFPRVREFEVWVDPDVPAKLEVRLAYDDGVPHRGRAGVWVHGDEAFISGPTSVAESNADGVFLFEGLPSGEHEVTVSPEGPWDPQVLHLSESSAAKRLVFPPGGTVKADFVVSRSGEITVDVVAADGSPVPAWVVDYEYRHGSGSGGASPRRILGCPPGDYAVKIWSKGFKEWKTTVRVDRGTPARVEARLVPGDGEK